MMEFINHVLNIELGAAQPAAQVGGRKQENHDPISTGAANGIIERCAVLTSSKEEGEQVLDSMMEVRRSPRQEPCVPSSLQDPVTSHMRGVHVNEVLKSAKPPPPEDATEDFGQGGRGVKRKAPSDDDIEEMVQLNDDDVEAMVQYIETRNKLVAEAIELILTNNMQAAEKTAKAQELWFYKEYEYLEKRDRQNIRIQKKLISAIKGLTEVIMTGLQNTAGDGDAINAINAGDVVDADMQGGNRR